MTLVDIAIKLDGDSSLKAEVSHYRAYRREVQRCAIKLVELRKEFLQAHKNVRESLAHLAAASAYAHIEPCVLHNLIDTQELPPAIRDTAIQDFANNWQEEKGVSKERCQWCENRGHDTWECCYLTKCVYCNNYGHSDSQCYHPHNSCSEKEVCNVTCDHTNSYAYCPSKIRTYGA